MEARFRWIICLWALLLAPLAAQDDPKFHLEARFEPATAAPGAAVTLVLTAETEPGWHAYGTLETTNIPVSLDVAKLQTGGLEVAGEPEIPAGNPKNTPIGTSFPLDEVFEVRLGFKVPEGASGAVEVEGELGYQICDATMCERPNEAPFTAKLTIGAAGQEPGAGGGEAAGKESGSAGFEMPDLGFKPGLQLEGDEKVTVKARFEPAEVRAGEVTTLVLDVHVIDGWHAYGVLEMTNVPVDYDQLKQDIGALEFEGEPIIPPGEEVETPIGPSFPLPHDFQVKQVLRVPAGTEAGDVAVVGVLDYQICTDSFCDQPAEAEYEAKLKVVAGEARAENSDAAAAQSSASGPEDDGGPFSSIWALILASIGGGLFALAMPCTYPMIPITFSFFTKQAEKRGGSVLPLTIVYGLGIVAMFVGVGTLLSAIIIDVVNHWVTNTVIGFMFFFFAFVLFGWVNLNPPQWMTNLATKAQMSAAKSGAEAEGSSSGGIGGLLMALAGVFFMGATLVITSFTCTAPIVGTLIAQIAKVGTGKVALGMAVFGLTMAIPFMMLSLMPTKVKSMPKSGQWMETLKISLGFVELAAAFKFVSMVDFARGWQILPRELFLMLWAAVFGLWAMFLFGILRKAGTVNEGVSNMRMASGMVVTLLASYFLFGALGNRLDPIMTSFIPNYSNSLVARGGGKAKLESKHVIVKDDPDAAMARAKSEGKMLLYNFTGFN